MDNQQIIDSAKETILIEKQALAKLESSINADFLRAVNLIHKSMGRVIVSGIGKSAIIAQKIVATLNSTGTAAIFMHAAEAIHGDLGMMQAADIAVVISKSGESAEIKVLVPLIKNFGNPLIAICGNENSFLAREADCLLNTTVDAEACPNNLAPTSSTTAQLVMGDALAVCLLKLKGFTSSDFARYHPGGALGKQLYLKVASLSNTHQKPSVSIDDRIPKVIVEITGKRLGATVVLDASENIAGIITDGDIRRMLEKHNDLNSLRAVDIMNHHPKQIEGSELAMDALHIMRANNISQLIVTESGHYQGIVHIHDLLREGIV